ncbi:vacuolar sorting-associated 37D, putative [Babesia ovata]|uniref:Vacuolar sorting-associated 37D, putative n=1 Tax=Babesia ovata TaxID=189622 RepID=A0A2H6KHA9_9APIC|nr:vacuolar sorting-associated 37D, putative [Babesia ovata]GBE62361.1 vacuolar sorting-associated 37D, putative [Babesia ovata]
MTPVEEHDSVEETLSALQRVLTTTEVEAMAQVNNAYTLCLAESGPIMQYLGAGYYVKRAPLTVKKMLELRLSVAKEKTPPSTQKQTTKTETMHTVEGDTIEIIERYDSSDE